MVFVASKCGVNLSLYMTKLYKELVSTRQMFGLCAWREGTVMRPG